MSHYPAYAKRLETTNGRHLNGYRFVECVGSFAADDGARVCLVHGGRITAEAPFAGCDER